MNKEYFLDVFNEIFSSKEDKVQFFGNNAVIVKKNNIVDIVKIKNSVSLMNLGYVVGDNFITTDNAKRNLIYYIDTCNSYSASMKMFEEIFNDCRLKIVVRDKNNVLNRFEETFIDEIKKMVNDKYPKCRNMPNIVKENAEEFLKKNLTTVKTKLLLNRPIFREYNVYPIRKKFSEQERIEGFLNKTIDDMAKKIFEENLHDVIKAKDIYENLVYEVMFFMYIDKLASAINVEQEKEKYAHYIKYFNFITSSNFSRDIKNLTFVYNAEPIIEILKEKVKEHTYMKLNNEPNYLMGLQGLIKKLEEKNEYLLQIPVENILASDICTPFGGYHVTDSSYHKQNGEDFFVMFKRSIFEEDKMKKILLDTTNIKSIRYRRKDILA